MRPQIALLCVLAVAQTSCSQPAHNPTPAVASVSLSGEPIGPIPLSVDLDPDVVALGSLLFHDSRLSHDDIIVLPMGRYQLGRQLTDAEIGLLVTFLKTLTGEYKGHPLQ